MCRLVFGFPVTHTQPSRPSVYYFYTSIAFPYKAARYVHPVLRSSTDAPPVFLKNYRKSPITSPTCRFEAVEHGKQVMLFCYLTIVSIITIIEAERALFYN